MREFALPIPPGLAKEDGGLGWECQSVPGRIDRSKLPTLRLSLQNHPRLRRRAGHLGRQHGHCLSRLRARLRRRRLLPAQRVGSRSGAQYRPRADLVPRRWRDTYVVTGKEDDGKAALAAEAGLKDAIDQSMKGTTNPARPRADHAAGQGIPDTFTQDFCRHSQGQAARARWWRRTSSTRGGTMLRYKLDDLASNADEAGASGRSNSAPSRLPRNIRRRRRSPTPSSSIPTRRSRPARWRGSNSSKTRWTRYSTTDEKIIEGLKEISALLGEYRQALTKLIENSKSIDELTAEDDRVRRPRSCKGAERHEGSLACRSATA